MLSRYGLFRRSLDCNDATHYLVGVMRTEVAALALGVVLALAAIFVLVWALRARAARRGQPPRALEPSESSKDGARSASDSAAESNAPIGAAPLVVLRRPAATRYPLVLAHGYFGFDAIGALAVRREYFRGVKRTLEALGHEVHVARVSPAAGVQVRAAQLARQIEKLRAPRVNIIAHSMGGLDARFAIAHHGLGPRVASLTTIGTPHRGTPLADHILMLGELRRLRRLLSAVGANVDGLYDVTTRSMTDFNRVVLDASDVFYASVIGSVSANAARVHALLAPGHAYLLKTVGPNDGIVPADSQRWGEVLHEVTADHWAQIGWSSGFDTRAFYVTLAESLATRGV